MGDKQIWYHIREGFRSIFTHGLMSFAAVCMTIACLLIMGSFSLVALNANHMLQDLEQDNEFLAYVNDGYTENQARALETKLKAIPNVSTVTFVTKAQALEDFKADQDNQALFADVPADTLRDRYRIRMVDIEQMEATVEAVKNVEGIEKVQASLEIADGFIMLRNVATALAIILVVMLVVISIAIIANTIKLATFTRREEIAIMKMCGATNWFVRWPFMVEGMILGLVGGILAFFCQWGVYGLIQRAMEQTGMMDILSTLPFSSIYQWVLSVFLVVGLIIGAGGSGMAIRRFLKV